MEAGLRGTVRRSKTDQEGAGHEIAIPRGDRLRHVEAVQTWLAAAEINRGPVFRPVLKGSRLQSEPLTDRSVAKIVKHYTGLAGSRSGAIRRAQPSRGFHHIGSGKWCGNVRIADQSRHKSIDTLRGYVRRAHMFKDLAGAAFL